MVVEEMNAVRLHRFGGPDVLHYERAPIPSPVEGEVLVRIHAVGVNPPDWYLREGMKDLPPEWRPHPSFPIILGTDVSGTVVELGGDVADFAIGDEIYAMVRFPEKGMEGAGAYAQFVTVPVPNIARKPDVIDHPHAAAAPMSLLTAWQFLIEVGHDEPNPVAPKQHAPVPLKGKRVLINGASGGVGHLALQLAKWQGAEVIAVASGKNEALMRDLGADAFIDYTKEAADEVVRDLDLVVDAVGGRVSARFLKTIKRGGALFPIFPLGFEAWDEAEGLGITVSAIQVRSSGAQLVDVGRLLDDGTIRVVIDSVYPLADAAASHERAARGGIQGKIVLEVA